MYRIDPFVSKSLCPCLKRISFPVEQGHPGRPAGLVIGVDVPVDADAAVVRAGEFLGQGSVFEGRPGLGLGGPVCEGDEEGLGWDGEGGAVRVALAVLDEVVVAATGAGGAGDGGVGVVGGEGDAAAVLFWFRLGDVAGDLPAGDGVALGREAAGVRELGRVDADRGPAFVFGVEDAVDLPPLRRVEGRPVQVRRHFLYLFGGGKFKNSTQ